MAQNDSERIVLDIPVNFTAEQLAQFCRISTDSSAFDSLEEALPYINQYGAPKAIMKWCTVDSVEDDKTTIDGVTFQSKVVADKLKDVPRVFCSVFTCGEGLEKCSELEDDVFLPTYNAALLFLAGATALEYMKTNFGYDGSSMLNPGSLPDWPISNNFPLFDIIGNVDEIGVTLNEEGYIKPWNSGSHIHFPGEGYQNCSLCKKYDCVGRHQAFNRKEYIRIFGMEP